MDALSFLHAVEDFMRRDLSEQDGDRLIEYFYEDSENGDPVDVQHMAELFMTKDDFKRIYGHA